MKTTKIEGRTKYDIHFWLGSESTRDEMGTAAYKTVELDGVLGGSAVEHREVQGKETELFLSYFEKGIVILAGGVDSGFTAVKTREYKPRLFQLKGFKNVRLFEVPLKHDSLNSGDVFFLDLGLTIIQFNGKKANIKEKMKGAEMGKLLKESKGGKAQLEVFEEGTKTVPQAWLDIFGDKPIKSAEEGGSDKEADVKAPERKIFRVCDESGHTNVTKVAEGKEATMDKLEDKDAFIVDLGIEIFAWIGKGASENEKKNGIKYAQAYAEREGKHDVPCSKIIQGYETDFFKKLFQN